MTLAIAIAGATSFRPGDSLAVGEESSKPVSQLSAVESRVIRLRNDDSPSRATAVTQSRVVLTGLAADPRGNLIAAAGDDNVVRIVGARSMVVLRELRGHRDLVRSIAFNHDGSQLASVGNDGQIIIWDRDGGFGVQRRLESDAALACVCFAPDGSELAAVGFDDDVIIVTSGGPAGPRLQCGCCDLRTVVYRDDGAVIVVAGRNGEVDLVDAKTHRQIDHQLLHQGRVRDADFLPGSDLLVSVGEDGHAVLLNTETRAVVDRIDVTSGRLFAVAAIDAEHVAVAGSDNVIRLIRIGDRQVVHRLEGHDGSIASLAAVDGHLFSGGYDATLRRWSLERLEGRRTRIAQGDQSPER